MPIKTVWILWTYLGNYSERAHCAAVWDTRKSNEENLRAIFRGYHEEFFQKARFHVFDGPPRFSGKLVGS